MSNPVVRLYLRVKLPDGSRPYLEPVVSANGKLKPHMALLNGRAEYYPDGVYNLRYRKGGKQVWEQVGSDPQMALLQQQRRERILAAQALGVEVVDEPESEAEPASGHPLSETITEYLTETKSNKSQRTFAAYNTTLKGFAATCRKKTLEAIDRKDMLAYIAHMKGRGNSPRTVRNRVDFLQIFFHHFGFASILKGKDLPKYTDKVVRAYSPADLETLFRNATQDESDLLQFMLCVGLREQEVQFACWSDLDLEAKTFTVTEKLALGFRPKDKEEGAIPIPASLVEILTARRERYPHTRLIFPGPNGQPNGHLLRTLKRLALRSGLNCGHCVNKAGKPCSTHPVCRNFVLHKMRKTFATMHHKNGMPPRTLMRLLRHSSLDVTLRYIADVDDEQTRNTVESSFAAFAGIGGAA